MKKSSRYRINKITIPLHMDMEAGRAQFFYKLRIAGLIAILSSTLVVYGHYLVILLPASSQTLATRDAEVQFQQSLDYIYGRGVPQDLGKALVLCKQSAEQGFAEAQFTLGMLYYNGFNGIVLQNYREAYVWFSLATFAHYKNAAKLRYEVGANLSPAELDAARKQIHDLRKLATQTHHD